MFPRDREPGYRDTDDRDVGIEEGDDLGMTTTIRRKSASKNKKSAVRTPQGNRSAGQRSTSNSRSKKRK